MSTPVEVSILPILLGGGVPLVAGLSRRIELKLAGQKTYEKTGTVSLVYEVKRSGDANSGVRVRVTGAPV